MNLNAKPESRELSREWVLSRNVGQAAAPKDFAWVATNIPCQAACPAGTDIPGYLDAIAQGRYEEAYRINLRDNVFPAVLGRVCTRPCEPACRHGWEGLGEPVAICFAKRSAEAFMRDKAPMVLPPHFDPTGKRIAVVGGGAAGLTAARELALFGHEVTVFEAHDQAGGMMVQGIPEFRLPREIVQREVEQVRLQGVQIRCGVRIGDEVTLAALLAEHDAVVLSPGTLHPTLPELPDVDLQGVRHGLQFLMEVNHGEPVSVGESVIVIGGGFTAVDCARSARRLGAAKVTLCYRRSAEEMYISGHEVEEMGAEGVGFRPLAMPLGFEGEAGRVRGVRFTEVTLGAPDESGRRRPMPKPGSEFVLEADTVLLATGQQQDIAWIDADLADAVLDENRKPRANFETNLAGRLFAAGDFVTGAVSLIDAIGHAKRCARQIDRALTGTDRIKEVVEIEDADETGRTREMDEIPRQPMPVLPPDRRDLRTEVETGYGEEAAREEARRCYLCHYKFELDNDLCIYCDRCLKVKPVEGCIVKVASLNFDEADRIVGVNPSTGTRDYNMLYIDQNQCIRCGACADVCPVECISLQKVSLHTVINEAMPGASH